MPAQSIHIDWSVICSGCARAPEDPEGECAYEMIETLRDYSSLIACSNWISPEEYRSLMQEPTEVQGA
uniref:Uncharacterized protein n=1 Tax=viral metagenome TaxID=1070528 RepID=A0A6M3KVD5_9ZZZZ